MPRRQLRSTLFPYTTLFRSQRELVRFQLHPIDLPHAVPQGQPQAVPDDAPPGYLLAELRGAVGADHDVPRRQLRAVRRSEEHTSELQSRFDLVCRLLLEKKK